MQKKQFILLIIIFTLSLSLYAQNIHNAVKTSNINQVKTLLTENSELVNTLDEEGNTPLILACVDPNVSSEIIELLIKSGADLQLGDPDNDTPLHYAAYSGNTKAAGILIENNADLDYLDVREQTPLHFAITRKHIEAATLLVNSGANLEARVYRSGNTPLLMAIEDKDEVFAEFLISKGAKVDIRNNGGRLPIYGALDICSSKIVNQILDIKSIIDLKKDGVYLMNAAITCKNSSVVNLLIEQGFDIKEADLIGQSLVHKAAANGMIDLIKTLENRGIDVDSKDVYGKSPLHISAKHGHNKVVEFLLVKEVDINLKTPIGKTALHLAIENEQTETINLLIKQGAIQTDWEFPKFKATYLGEILPKDDPLLFAPGIISTEERFDYAISFHPKESELLLSTRIYGASNHMLSMKVNNGYWSKPERPLFASNFPEGEPIYTPDGKQIIFQSQRPATENSETQYDTWIIDDLDNNSTPKLLSEPFKNPQFLMYISSTMDNKIYFTSNGGTYTAVKNNTGYDEAIFLGGNINSPSEGKHPFIDPDESFMIFDASNRLDGLGESDLYISFKKEDGSWTTAQNLGDKINSSANEICASISGDGKFLFYNSDKNGNGDIYWIGTSFIEGLKNKTDMESKEIFKLQYQTLGKSRSFSIEYGDLNGDNYQDILMVNYFSPSRIWFNNGDNTFEMKPNAITTAAQEEHGGAIADIDQDGDLDILIVTTRAGNNKIHLNDGSGKFTISKNTFLTQGISYGNISLKDVDADGDLDAFLLVYQGSNELWINQGNALFTKSEQIFGPDNSSDMGVVDLDGDGDVDVLLTIKDAAEEVWLNNGTGIFEKSASILGSEDGYESVTMADLDNDGDLDAAISNFDHGIAIWLNDGKGHFKKGTDYFSHCRHIEQADIDNDGDIDLYSSDRIAGDVLLLNDGKANFTEASLINEISLRSGFVDIDNDGDLDLILSKGLNARGNGLYINQTIK